MIGMRRRRFVRAAAVAAAGTAVGCLDDDSARTTGGDSDSTGAVDTDDDTDTPDWPSDPYAGYDTTRVIVETADGGTLGVVRSVVAKTREERYLGLSDAESLPEDGGMLFVYDAPRESLTFVMRRMDFGIDIVYADADGTITRIHNAPAPGPDEDGTQQRYPGSGQYVLEVPYEWTDRNDVVAGDVLRFEL